MQQERGFTILELILSICILSVAIVGIFSSFSLILMLSAVSSDRLTAVYLAQEGLEIAINVRDTNWLVNNTWNSGLYPDCDSGCQLDFTYGTQNNRGDGFSKWVGQGSYLAHKDGFYRYDPLGTTFTKFKRKITTTLLSQDAMRVTSEVFWDQKTNLLNPRGQAGSFKVEVVLYNWNNNP